MQRLLGQSTLSPFRVERLMRRLQVVMPRVTQVEDAAVYFWMSTSPFSSDAEQVMGQLLQAGPDPVDAFTQGVELWVIPRPGTISPWATKATDILRGCGLDALVRVEKGTRYRIFLDGDIDKRTQLELGSVLHDRMTEAVLSSPEQASQLFRQAEPRRGKSFPILANGIEALKSADEELGLALSGDEMDYLVAGFRELERDPTAVELMMFAQANSEHCRHKIFNASWTIDGEPQAQSLFDMIRHTYRSHPGRVLSAYSDNAAVMEGSTAGRFFPDPQSAVYGSTVEPIHILMKVETHNHPTAISPHPGAGTGNGGEIRDEGATGRGGKPKAGLTGFSVSSLQIPGFSQPWEVDHGRPTRMASALDIMLEAPIGGAAYNNEFGRPNLTGYFRSFELEVPGPHGAELRGYHKPIMIAGGYGNIRESHVLKHAIPAGAKLVVLGGPAMLIGLGGGAASSVGAGASTEALDFASVQRANPEMERRCQEVIDRRDVW